MNQRMRFMKTLIILISTVVLVNSCRNNPKEWGGPVLVHPRDQLTVEQLLGDSSLAFFDMSYFAEPDWSVPASTGFSGTILLEDTRINFFKQKAYYPGENLFPKLQLDFITHQGVLIPLRKDRIITRFQSDSYWDVVVGAGKVWHEPEDGEWNRASFPLTLTDRWVGQARNCVAAFVYKPDTISNICLQCSQETADIDDMQLGDINGMLPAGFEPKRYVDSAQIVERHKSSVAGRIPVHPLSEIDEDNMIARHFDIMIHSNAPTSLGAVFMNNKLYLHPPSTRHGPYPYPDEMRHGLYSVTMSLAGALAMMYLEERYEEDVFGALITDYVPALATHAGWQGVTFSHTLNMVTGTAGGEDAERLYSTLIVAETAEEAIRNIAGLGDAPEPPGRKFNYASTNLFVLSYAMQKFVEKKEGRNVNYWDLVHDNVLGPIGAEHFTVLHTLEKDEESAIPVLAYGALPTIDEAVKIALLFANYGKHGEKQILHENRVKEVFGQTPWKGYSTDNDYRGTGYRHAFWSKEIKTKARQGKIMVTFMLGFGENYIVFLSDNTVIFRFLDEHDLDIDELIKDVVTLKSPVP